MVESSKRRIGALVFEDVETLDLFGPLEMFGTLEAEFEIALVAETDAPLKTRHGQTIVPNRTVDDPLSYDLLLVPGGRGTPIQNARPAVDAWLKAQSLTAELITSVCTGSGLLARNGLLDGHRATTNKRAFDWVSQFGSNVTWVPRARWVEDGKFFTSSGVSAGMDMSLAVIAKLLGQDAAEEVSRITEYTWHRDASVDPFAVELA
ncbi:MAG: DJ-1/PfpI family protein [Pseudomonadota bacterium]